MKRGKKIAVGLFIFFSVAVMFLLAVILAAPRLIEHATIENMVRGEVSRLVGGEFDFKRIDLSFFPIPHVVLTETKVDLPQHVAVSVPTIEIYPQLLPLLTGKIKLKEAVLRQPEITATVRKSTAGNENPATPPEIDTLLPVVSGTLANLPKAYIPINFGKITKGRIVLVSDNKPIFTLDDIDADLKTEADTITVQATATSAMVDRVSFSSSTDIKKNTSTAHIVLKNLQFATAYTALLPDSDLKLHDGATDMNLDLSINNSQEISMDFGLTIPHLRLERAGQSADVNTKGLTGRVHFSKNSTTLTVSELLLDKPAMHVSGSVIISEEDPKLHLQLEARDIDIKAARTAALAVAGTNPATQTVFDILQAGDARLITISAQANTLNDLGSWDNLTVQAQVQNGEAIIPGTHLEVTDVAGDVAISQGILTIEDLQAKRGNTLSQSGSVTLDMKKDPMPLHVETEMDTDLADLPAILKHVVDDKEVNQEIDLIKDISGRADGKLVLDGDTNQLKVEVSASDIQGSAQYHKIPYPVTLNDGTITYDEERIQWDQLSGSIGTSSFAVLSGGLGLGEQKELEITFGTSRISVSELLPWAESLQTMVGFSKYYGGGKGVLQLSAITLNGPLQDFRKWQFNITGELEDLLVQNLPARPGLLNVASLKFNANPKTLRYIDAQLSMLDFSGTVSGTHQHYLAGFDRDVSLSFASQMGSQSTLWLSKLLDTPTWLKLQPLTFKTSSLTYTNQGKRTLSATLAVQDRLKIVTKMRLDTNEVVVEKLSVSDKASRATLGGSYKDQLLDVSFNGNLHESTLGQLLQETPGLKGWIKGKARVHLDLKHPYSIRMDGKLNGHNLFLPLHVYAPLTINDLAVKGDKNLISLQKADLSWNDMQLTMSGSIEPRSPDSLELDLDVEADSVDVERLTKHLGVSKDKAQEQSSSATLLPGSLQGNIRFKTKSFKTSTLTVEPLQAQISLHDHSADITLKESKLCGILMPGSIKVSSQGLQFDIAPQAQGLQLKETMDCIASQVLEIDGTLDLTGSFTGQGDTSNLLKASSGQIEISFSDGHIYHDIVMLNVLKFLIVNKVITGILNAEQIMTEGFDYKDFHTLATLHEGKLSVKEIVLISDEVTITGTGKIDLLQKQFDFTILAAPYSTINTVLEHIPLIGDALQTVATIPLSVTGTIDTVRVLPLTASAIGHELGQVMKETLGIPMKLVHIAKFHGAADSDAK